MISTLSVIILGYDNDETLLDAVDSVVEQMTWATIEPIVVTSGGGRAAEIVGQAHPDIAVHSVSERWTVARARNQGIEMATGDVIAFLAADCRARPGWAAARIKAHSDGHQVVTGPVTAPNRPTAGLAHALLNYHTRSPRLAAEPVEWPDPRVHSASFVASVFDQIGPFDPSRNRGEDSDMAQRLTAASIPIWFEPNASIDHVGPPSYRSLAADEFQRAGRFVRVNQQQIRWNRNTMLAELRFTIGRLRSAWRLRPDDLGTAGTASLAAHLLTGATTHRIGRLLALRRGERDLVKVPHS